MMNAEFILRTLSEPVLLLDESLRAVLANAAFYETLQIHPGELDGKSIQELVLGESGQPQLQAVLETIVAQDANVDRMEVECGIPPHTHKLLSVSARRLIVDEGRTTLVLVELRDITVEKEREDRLRKLNEVISHRGAELERINRDLESFNRWISHDLRTPLRFTNTIAHQLLEDHGPELPAGAEDKVRMILASTREMGKLVEKLLAFAQMDRVPIKRRRIDVGRLAREALADLKEDRRGRCVEIVIDELPPCHADRTLLKQVFLNLLANAQTFTRLCERAEIRVGFMQGDGATTYFVRDNGMGFEMAEADSIFEPFHRLHGDQPLQGTGIGLTLVKRIVGRHGGRTWAEGKPSGGATFYFQLGEQSRPGHAAKGTISYGRRVQDQDSGRG
jgi:signal transduction histidine kinase